MDDNFNTEDHGIENDEIAKIYAEADMKEEERKWIKDKVKEFYKDFENLSIDGASIRIKELIKTKSLSKTEAIKFIDNMIEVFCDDEEYEKCTVCAKIKNKLDDKI